MSQQHKKKAKPVAFKHRKHLTPISGSTWQVDNGELQDTSQKATQSAEKAPAKPAPKAAKE